MQKECRTMFRFIWLSFLEQPRKHLSVALIFGIDLAQPHRVKAKDQSMFQTNKLILEDSKRRNVCNVLLCPAELCIFAGAKLGWSIQCRGSLAHYIFQAIMAKTGPGRN